METTARFYLERIRAQVDQARRRRYPKASDAPAKWLSLIAGKLMAVHARLADPAFLQNDRTKAEALLVDLNVCYDDLQILAHADTTQVASFVVSALHRLFERTDDACDYLFTSGITFEVEQLYDSPPADFFHEDYRRAVAKMKAVLYRITMPGGALGATFHIPLVAHEVGHVLMFKLEREGQDDKISELCKDHADDEVYKNWVKEIIADTICAFVAGPAGFFALYEKLRGAGDRPDEEYPHNFIRLTSLRAFVTEQFQAIFDEYQIQPTDWESWSIWSEAQLLATDYQGVDRFEEDVDYTSMSHRLITALPAIREVAKAFAYQHIGDLEYRPSQFKSDLGAHLESFLNAIPPFETRDDLRSRKPTELVSILNVGWFIAAFRMKELKITPTDDPKDVGPRLVCLDQLILKAIELSEVRREWMAS